jgi:hypothetical protein
MRGRYLGVSAITWSLALIIGPGLGMKLFTYNPTLYWLSCGVMSLVAASIILMTVKPRSEATSFAEKAQV